MTKGKKRKTRKFLALKVTGLVLGCAVAAGGGYFFYMANQYQGKFLKGTVINRVNVGSMSVSAVEQELAKSVQQYALTVTFANGQTETIHDTDIDYGYHPDGSIQALLDGQNTLDWYKGYLGQEEETEVKLPISYDKESLAQLVAQFPELQADQNTAATAPKMELVDNQFVVTPGKAGVKVDAARAAQLIQEAVDRGDATLDLSTPEAGVYQEDGTAADAKALQEKADRFNKLIGASITYELPGGEKQVLDKDTLFGWLTQDAEGNYTMDEAARDAHIRRYVADLAAKVNTIGTQKTFNATGVGPVQVRSMTYGYEINQEAEVAYLRQALADQVTEERKPTYKTWETSDPSVNGGFGNTYIEIDLTRQHLWAYRDGQVVLETDIVSGAADDPEKATPPGAWMFVTKESPSTLIGKDKEGHTIYETKVQYFMPFEGMAVGIHDAPWQAAFGGTRYKDGYGSHGCINVPPEMAAKLYEMITWEEPVVVYNS